MSINARDLKFFALGFLLIPMGLTVVMVVVAAGNALTGD